MAGLLRHALTRVIQEGSAAGSNLIAFSGGVDSSLVAALVHDAFPGRAYACLGVSPSLPAVQLDQARTVAQHIGIPLKEVPTREGDSPEYVANQGQSCFHCKTHLYSALQAVVREGASMQGPVVLFNGTNAEDRKDTTRLGLVAARDFEVRSPIDHLTKAQVRELARHLGLPNWSHAASPCLRSRLAWGVVASEAHLRLVEKAELEVRRRLAGTLQVHHNLRVRMLPGSEAAVEVDEELLEEAQQGWRELEEALVRLGLAQRVRLRQFKSGSVARHVTVEHSRASGRVPRAG